MQHLSSNRRLYGLFALVASAALLFILLTATGSAATQAPPSDVYTAIPDKSLVHAPDAPVWSDYIFTTATTAPPGMPVGAGGSHSCRLESDGTATCWGSNADGRSSPPEDTFVALSVGESHSCGLKSDGTAVCWGDNEHGQATPSSGETFTSITVGGQHTCGLREDGIAVCWGRNFYGQATPPRSATVGSIGERQASYSSITFTSLDAGEVHTCGVRSSGATVCWGDTRNGRSSAPSGETFTSVSAGGSHTCGLRSDGSVACWGSNANGQSTPPTSGVFTSVSAGGSHTCALRNDGVTVCWGNNAVGQAAPPAATPRPTPSATPTGSTTPTASATPGSIAERVTGLEGQVGMLAQLIRDLRDAVNALTNRIVRLEEGAPPIGPRPTVTPTATGMPTATPTRTATPTVAANCIQKMGLGWLTGAWRSGCESTKTPANAETGTRYARYYTFTLDAPADVTVTVTSDDVSETYVYLLEEVGNHGAIVATHASRISQRLQPGSYTIEATTYNPRATGDFTLTLDISRRWR